MAQITITYPDALDSVLQWARQEHGASVIDELVINYLRDRETHQLDMDIEAAKSDKADAATKSRLRARLKL